MQCRLYHIIVKYMSALMYVSYVAVQLDVYLLHVRRLVQWAVTVMKVQDHVLNALRDTLV